MQWEKSKMAEKLPVILNNPRGNYPTGWYGMEQSPTTTRAHEILVQFSNPDDKISNNANRPDNTLRLCCPVRAFDVRDYRLSDIGRAFAALRRLQRLNEPNGSRTHYRRRRTWGHVRRHSQLPDRPIYRAAGYPQVWTILPHYGWKSPKGPRLVWALGEVDAYIRLLYPRRASSFVNRCGHI